MTLALAPDFMTSPAPSAQALMGPPGASASTTPADTSTPSPFAALLQAVVATQGDGETAPPIGGTPSLPASDPALADLLARLASLIQGVSGGPGEAGPTASTDSIPLLDRLAEAGADGSDGSVDLPAVEALMAYLLMAQATPMEGAAMPALPDDVLALMQASATDGELTLGADAVDIAAQRLATANVSSASSEAAFTLAASGAPAAMAMGATAAAAGLDKQVESASMESIDSMLAGSDDASTEPSTTDVGAEALLPAAPGDAIAPTAIGETATADAPTVESPSSEAARMTSEDAESAANRLEAALGDVTSTAQSSDTAKPDGMPDTPVAPMLTPTSPVAARIETVESTRPVTAVTLPGEIADTVRMAAFRGDAEVRLVLNPPDLGHLDIRITSGDGGLRVTLEASQSGTRDLIDRSLVQLQQALESRDLRLDRIEVRAADGGRAAMDGSGHQSHGRGNGANGGDGQPEWSPIAALNALSSVSAPTTSIGASQTNTVGDDRLDVMA